MGRSDPVALMSGLLCDGSVWAGQSALGHQAEVHVFHFPSHDTIGDMAESVLDTMLGRFIAAGHSMGGRVALEIVRRDPSRVSGLALLNTGTHPSQDGETAKRRQLVDLAFDQGMAALAQRWLPPMLAPHRSSDRRFMAPLLEMVCRSTPEIFARQVAALLARPDARPGLAQIACPTVLASGTLDGWSPLSQHDAMHAAIPGSWLTPIEDSGHMSLVEQPAAVLNILLQLIAACNGGPPNITTFTGGDDLTEFSGA